MKNSKKDGTWITDTGFPYNPNSNKTANVKIYLVPLTNKKVFVLYTQQYDKIYGRLYDPDTGWGAEETLSDYNAYVDLDAAADGDDVHFIYGRPGVGIYTQIRYNKRSSDGSLGTEIAIANATSQTRYALCVDETLHIVYLFYSDTDSIRFLIRRNGEWSAIADFVAGEGGSSPVRLSQTKNYRQIGVAWHKASPTELRFQAYTILPSSLKSNSHTL
jgi:hypothetical protein